MHIPPIPLSPDTLAEQGAAAVQAARLSRQPVSILLVEIDHFALIDRTHGAPFAEHVVATVAMLARDALRPRDAIARRSTSQFAILLTGTPGALAAELGRRVADAVREHAFRGGEGGRPIPVRVSVGVATAPMHAESYPGLLAAAERALQAMLRDGDGVRTALDPALEPLHPPLDVDRFVGRTDQLRTLVRALDDAMLGRLQLAVVHGEVGAGCSTLVAQLAPEVAVRGGAFVRGVARPLPVRPPYGAWAEVLESLQRVGGAPAGEWRELPHLVPSIGGAQQREGTGGSQFRLLEELAGYISAAAASRPLMLVLDDMQWADDPTWDALDHLVPKLADVPLFLVVVLRDDPRDPAALERRQRIARLSGAIDVTVSRLTRDEVKRWVEGAFHRQEIARELLSFIYRNTEGNPLFVGQLLRALVEEGAVRHNGERWEWRAVSELPVPANLEALLMNRISRFGPRAQVALATAAVLRRETDPAILVTAGSGTEEEIQRVIADAVAAGIMRHCAAAGAADRYAFAHDRIADVILARLAPQRVRRAHERGARALESRDAAASPATALEVAIHHDLAGASAGAYAGALRAADHAERLYAHATASDLLRLAGRNAGSPAELAAVRTRLATLAELAGQYDEAEELCDLAIEWYSGQGDQARSLTLRSVRERLRSQLGQPARRTLDNLLALDREAAEHGLAAERVAILTLVSQTYGRLGDRSNAERIASECVAMAESIGDPALLADSLNRLAITMELVEPEAAKKIYARALTLYEARADYRGQARIHNNLGIVAQLQGDLDNADRELATAIALARTAGMPDFWGAAALNLGVMTMKAGGYARARELLQEALSLFATVKNSELQLYALYNLAHLEREQGEFYSAAELYEVAVSLAQRIGQLDVEAGALGGGGLSLLELGRADEAAAALLAAEERVRERPDWFQGRELIETLGVRVALAGGQVREAVGRYERAARVAEGSDMYTGAWLTSECAPLLRTHAPEVVAENVAYYAARVEALGYGEMTERFAALAGLAEGPQARLAGE